MAESWPYAAVSAAVALAVPWLLGLAFVLFSGDTNPLSASDSGRPLVRMAALVGSWFATAGPLEAIDPSPSFGGTVGATFTLVSTAVLVLAVWAFALRRLPAATRPRQAGVQVGLSVVGFCVGSFVLAIVGSVRSDGILLHVPPFKTAALVAVPAMIVSVAALAARNRPHPGPVHQAVHSGMYGLGLAVVVGLVAMATLVGIRWEGVTELAAGTEFSVGLVVGVLLILPNVVAAVVGVLFGGSLVAAWTFDSFRTGLLEFSGWEDLSKLMLALIAVTAVAGMTAVAANARDRSDDDRRVVWGSQAVFAVLLWLLTGSSGLALYGSTDLIEEITGDVTARLFIEPVTMLLVLAGTAASGFWLSTLGNRKVIARLSAMVTVLASAGAVAAASGLENTIGRLFT